MATTPRSAGRRWTATGPVVAAEQTGGLSGWVDWHSVSSSAKSYPEAHPCSTNEKHRSSGPSWRNTSRPPSRSGPATVASAPGVAVSSATVRNDMAVLEQEGYLRQPHTSAGRVPTDKGYRFFVDALTQPSLDQSSAQQVRSFFNRAHGEIESMLQDTTRLLSNLTDTAAMVVGPPHQDVATVRSVQLVGLAPRVRCSWRSCPTGRSRSGRSTFRSTPTTIRSPKPRPSSPSGWWVGAPATRPA